MDAAGHADVNTAMRYQHSLDRRKDILAEKLGANLLPDETPELLLARIGRVDEDIAGLERQHADLVARLQEL